MSRRASWLLFAGAVVVIVALLVTSIAFARRTPAYPALPHPNGYNDLVQAGKSIAGRVGDFPTLTQADLRDLLRTNAEALRLCRLGLSRTCAVPTELMITNFALVLPDMSVLKGSAQLLAAQGRLAELEGRPGDAAMSYAQAIQLGNGVSRGGLLIHRLVGVAIQSIGGTRLMRLIPELNPQEARPVLQILDQTDVNAVTWEEVLRNERLFAAHELRKLPGFVSTVAAWWSARSAKDKALERHLAAVAHVRLMSVELALRLYVAENKRAPGNLQDLVPNYLSHTPIDPFSGGPLIYKPQQTNWLVYSVGPDGVDDGGSVSGTRPRTGDVLYTSGW